MKILITGAGGQLAWELQRSAPAHAELLYTNSKELDISNAEAVNAYIQQHKPDVIINAAAYTAVDKAEADPDRAYAVNEIGVKNLANACDKNTYILHISTDFVFDGRHNKPQNESASTAPLSVYGASKYAGEQALSQYAKGQWAIVRTAWVYSAHGNNFVKSMLKFMQEREVLNIVVDQVGTPTWAKGLAQACWAAVANQAQGIYHWSDAGLASWYDFAEAIQREGLALGLITNKARLNAIPTEEYPLPATRPAFSVLDKRKILTALPELHNSHWQAQLKDMMLELKQQQHATSSAAESK